jgi:hypothetical protein
MKSAKAFRSRVIHAPGPLVFPPDATSVFLAGSIEMGGATEWQRDVISALEDLPIVVLNPRRSDWDSSWTQSVSDPEFCAQVTWELDALERATRIVMYFDPTTKAPVTLLELGLFAASGKLVVCCPEGYFRKGNVDIVCRRHGVPQVESLDGLVETIRADFQARATPTFDAS